MEKIHLWPGEVIERFIKSRGPGGQNVNKTATCVYLRHLPSGIVVKCQAERSQAANRARAWKLLSNKVRQQAESRRLAHAQELARVRRSRRKRSPAAKERMLQQKHLRAEKKKLRARVHDSQE